MSNHKCADPVSPPPRISFPFRQNIQHFYGFANVTITISYHLHDSMDEQFTTLID
jgi:hypothetical protein